VAINIEIKARVRDVERLHSTARALADGPGQLIEQEDIFFHTSRGRLKLRILGEAHGQLVYYERPDGTGPRASHYFISETTDPTAVQQLLAKALGERGVVKKRRWLYWVGQTRIHVDEVQGLGPFMELEVVMGPGQHQAEGEAIAQDLMERLGVRESDLVDVAYIDLLESTAA
jgi:predicted adenylyl cyclase CyaB